MKALKYIRRSSSVRVEKANVRGGVGTITIGDWTGSVIWGTDEHGWEHVSVSPVSGITPSWDDMCRIKDIFWSDEEEVIQIHPKKSEYVNIVNNCLHLWRPLDLETQRRLGGRSE